MTLSEADLTTILQRAWDGAATAFEEAVERECSRDVAFEPKLASDGLEVHTGAALWLNLDDCVADDESATNFAYGQLHAVNEIASDIGLRIVHRFPGPPKGEADATT